jgi:hypothetical protein
LYIDDNLEKYRLFVPKVPILFKVCALLHCCQLCTRSQNDYKLEELTKVPKASEIEAIIKHFHEEGEHAGGRATFDRLKHHWESISTTLVDQFVFGCAVCQQTSTTMKKNESKLKPILARGLFDRVLVSAHLVMCCGSTR